MKDEVGIKIGAMIFIVGIFLLIIGIILTL